MLHSGTVRQRRDPGELPLGRALLVLAVLITVSPAARCEWSVETRSNVSRVGETRVAYTENDAGYSMEIYRDASDAVRSRFSLPGGMLAFASGTCPTYQIDRGMPANRSINDAPCLTANRWAEFVLGYISGSHIASSRLLAIMNGITIVFRFKLENGDYRSTQFSLQGSKRAMTEVFGEEVSVGTR